jgi:hypothetical protein
MKSLPTRRQVIRILPLAGVGLLAACSDKPAPAPAAAPAPAPAAPPAPAPTAPPAAASPATPPATSPAPAAAPATGALVSEDDPVARSLSYVADNQRVDRARHPNFKPEQRCDNCALYQGAAGSAAGGCPLFGNRLVAAPGWCTAWARKG